jgi:hypothetical protein
MNRKALILYLLLAGLYAMIACFVHACYSLWYSNIPERVVFLQHYLDSIGETALLGACAFSMLLVAVGGVLMFTLKLIDRTWLIVYSVVPPMLGFILSEMVYLISF